MAQVFNAQLCDGRIVNTCTESGANALLQSYHGTDYFFLIVEKMAMISAKHELNAEEKTELSTMSYMLETVSHNASDDNFREYFSRSAIQAWLDLMLGQIKRFTKSRDWITTGKLPGHYHQLLNSCISILSQPLPVLLAFNGEFFNVLADFVKARKGTGRALPCDEICDTITLTISNAYNTTRIAFDNRWMTEKALKKLEASGALEQFIRCATVPQKNGSSPCMLLDELQACLPFISKKIRPGQPCGDTVIAILEHRDGSTAIRPTVVNKLQTMIKFANSLSLAPETSDGKKMCRNCGNGDDSKSFQNSLMRCSRCHDAYYCSKECQRADWKTHKKNCKLATKKDVVEAQNSQQTLEAFIERHYVHLMVKLVETCNESELSKNDMLVELNFTANKSGIVPAMQDKAEFKIAPIVDFVEGSRPALPDWWHEEEDMESIVEVMKRKHSKLKPSEILCLLKCQGRTSCSAVYSIDPITREEKFSQETFLAFKAKVDNDDDGPLLEIFGPLQLLAMRLEFLNLGYGIAGP